MNQRSEIEQTIISAIIYADAFPTAASILSTKHFQNISYALIFETANSLYPTIPINVVTVRNKLQVTVPDQVTGLSQEMVKLGLRLVGCNQVRYMCLLLLEINIKEGFLKELHRWRDSRLEESSSVETAVLTEIIEMLNVADIDILSVIEQAIKYFDIQDMKTEYQEGKLFNEAIARKANSIRRTVTLDTALSAAYKIVETSHEVKQICDKLISALNHMIVTNQIKPEYIKAADLL